MLEFDENVREDFKVEEMPDDHNKSQRTISILCHVFGSWENFYRTAGTMSSLRHMSMHLFEESAAPMWDDAWDLINVLWIVWANRSQRFTVFLFL